MTLAADVRLAFRNVRRGGWLSLASQRSFATIELFESVN